MNQVIQTPEQQYYLIKLLGYNYEILYKLGKTNATADALSRNLLHNTPSGTLFVLSTPSFLILEDIKKEQSVAPELSNTTTLISDNSKWTTRDGIFLFAGRIYIPSNFILKETILREYHNSPEGGNGGIYKTFMRVSANFLLG